MSLETAPSLLCTELNCLVILNGDNNIAICMSYLVFSHILSVSALGSR